MNKKSFIILAIVITLLIGLGIFLYIRNQNNASNNENSNYEANKTATNTTTDSTQEQNNTEKPETLPPQIKEEQIATYTTKIYSSDSARQNNITITCNTLNDTVVKNGETFSFCGTVGQASTSKGYQKADIFDKNGNKKKGLGGRKLPN